jgi:ParB/RepB/Spo0J family partition protein
MRREISEESITELAESISRLGLIHPVVIRRDGKLIAGERRLKACQFLGWTSIPVSFAEDLPERELYKIELEENVKRQDMTWQDRCLAMLRLHELNLEENPKTTYEETGDSAGISRGHAQAQIAVAKELRAGNPRLAEVKEFSVARGIVQRQTERAKQDQLSQIKVSFPKEPASGNGTAFDGHTGVASVVAEKPPSPIITASFLEWVETYSGQPFNFIHCDFPYGINANKFNQGASDAFGGYEDTPELYWSLVRALIEHREKLLGSSGHILFWFSMRYYTETLAALSEHFWVDPYPLIWFKSDNVGTLPDPTRGPRRVYEVAFLCSHGDRKIISSVANTFAAPTVRTGEHMSEKNPVMLRHFMRMFVDENTRLLDPTCGSGSALRAARSLACTNLIGLEINSDFADAARRAFDAEPI